MKTIRIELKQGENTLNFSRSFDTDLRAVTTIGNTVAGHILNVFNTAKEHGIKLGFKFSQSFELNIHSDNQTLNFKDSLFAEMGLKGFKVVNTDKSKERLCTFIGAMVEQTMFKAQTDEIYEAQDLVDFAKKILTAPSMAN